MVDDVEVLFFDECIQNWKKRLGHNYETVGDLLKHELTKVCDFQKRHFVTVRRYAGKRSFSYLWFAFHFAVEQPVNKVLVHSILMSLRTPSAAACNSFTGTRSFRS